MQNKAVKLSLAATVFCFALVVALAFAAPWLVGWYAQLRRIRSSGQTAILVAFYCCVPPVLAALVCLMRLLANIRAERVFSRQNTRLMAILSWCCAAVALATAACCRWYAPLLFVTGSMAFLFLIVRVVRNCFIAAAAIKEENSLTI